MPKRHCLAYQLTGWYDHTFSGDEFSVKPDTLFFIRENEAYSVKGKEYGESICVTFAAETPLATSIIDCKDNPEIKKLFYKLLNYKDINIESNKCYATAILYEILAFVYKNKEAEYVSPGIKGKIAESYRYMLEHYTEQSFKASMLAVRSKLSSKYHRNMFKKIYGCTPTQCLIELRLNRAAELLSEGKLSVGQVASMVGFSDVYYFSKTFKKHMLDSPKNFMNSIEI